MCVGSNHYETPCSCLIAGHRFSGKVCRTVEDPEWDAFLQGSHLGHFQQSSLWAQAKLADGWKPIRFLLQVDGRLAGGFQILTRQSRVGKIGYISKGPVLESEDPALLEYIVKQVVWVVRTCRIRALIAQPPDESRLNGALLARHLFLPNHLVDVISATLLVDLAGGMADIEKQMRKSMLMQVNRARRRGVTIREGDERDVGVFFSLMASTCERQGTRPSPHTESAMMALWNAFHPCGAIRLTLAECEGETVAGLLCLRFGPRVTAWKKGWSGKYSDRYPNQLLSYEAIEWAQRTGANVLDFAAMRRDIAEAMLEGKAPVKEWESSRDWFNLGFGNRPQLLPESKIYISNPLARFLYKGVGLVCGLGPPARSEMSSVKIS